MGKVRFLIWLLAGITACLWVTAAGATVYVRGDAAGGGDGNSWATAYNNLQTGITDADAGNEEVWVKAGTYSGALTVKSGVAVYGGFAGTEGARDDRNWTVNVTTITAPGSAHAVTMESSTRLDGFTVRDSGTSGTNGGGIYSSGSSAVTVENLIVRDNIASSGAGAYFDTTTNTLVAHCTFARGDSNNGAGVFFEGCSSPVVRSIVCVRNTADNVVIGGSGAGVYFDNCTNFDAQDCLLADNFCYWEGAGVDCNQSGGTIERNYFVGNTVGTLTDGVGRGGGVFVWECCGTQRFITIKNNVFVGNWGLIGAGANMSRWDGGLTYSLVHNTFLRNYSPVDGGTIFMWSWYNANGDYNIFNNLVAYNLTMAVYEDYSYGGSRLNIVHPRYNLFYQNDPANANVDWRTEYGNLYTGAAQINANIENAVGNRDGAPALPAHITGTWSAPGTYGSDSFQTTLTAAPGTFVPNQLVGWAVNPGTTQYRYFYILANTDSTLQVWGDASAIAGTGASFDILDFHLTAASDAIDHAENQSVTDDYDRQTRPQNEVPDIGADEYTSPTPTPTSQPTDTATVTPTDTPTSTATDSPTITPTATPTDTATASPTNTPTASPTDTPTSSPTATATDTPSATPSSTPTDTPPATATATRTSNVLGIEADWKSFP